MAGGVRQSDGVENLCRNATQSLIDDGRGRFGDGDAHRRVGKDGLDVGKGRDQGIQRGYSFAKERGSDVERSRGFGDQ
jgi:hypothetical protein